MSDQQTEWDREDASNRLARLSECQAQLDQLQAEEHDVRLRYANVRRRRKECAGKLACLMRELMLYPPGVAQPSQPRPSREAPARPPCTGCGGPGPSVGTLCARCVAQGPPVQEALPGLDEEKPKKRQRTKKAKAEAPPAERASAPETAPVQDGSVGAGEERFEEVAAPPPRAPTPGTDHDAWLRDVREPAEAACRNRRELKAKGARLEYRDAPISSGWAITWRFELASSVASAPWQGFADRATCLGALWAAARAFFSTADNKAIKPAAAMLDKIDKASQGNEPASIPLAVEEAPAPAPQSRPASIAVGDLVEMRQGNRPVIVEVLWIGDVKGRARARVRLPDGGETHRDLSELALCSRTESFAATSAQSAPQEGGPSAPLKGEPIGPLGVTAAQLDKACVAALWNGKPRPKVPRTVKPVLIGDQFYVVTEIGYRDGQDWRCLPLYPVNSPDGDTVRTFGEVFPQRGMLSSPGHPNDDAYFGTLVKLGKREYAIGPKSEARTLIQVKEVAS